MTCGVSFTSSDETPGPVFTIATPARNALACLRLCVDSVRRQRVPLQHIVQDAASDDGTRDWLAAQPDLLWASEPDAGMYDAIGRAWAKGSGAIFAWLNADEQYLPGTLDHVARFLSAHPEADGVFGDCILVDANGSPLAARREIPLRRWYIVNGILYAHSCALFVRTAVVRRIGPPSSAFRIAGDLDWVIRLMDAGVRIVHTRRFLSLFTISGSNLSTDPGATAEVESIRCNHGAWHHTWRWVPRLVRRTEKALHGCYAIHHVRYPWPAVDGGVHDVHAHLGSRWRWGLNQ